MITEHKEQVKNGSMNNNQEPPYFPTLAHIKEGRCHEKSWLWVMTTFLPRVEAQARKNLVLSNLETWCTNVSEALVQVLIENNYEAWEEEATYTKDVIRNY